MRILIEKLREVIQREISELTKGVHLEAKSTLPDFIHAIRIKNEPDEKTFDVQYSLEFVNKKLDILFGIRIEFKYNSLSVNAWNSREKSVPNRVKAYKYKLLTFIEEEIERFNNE